MIHSVRINKHFNVNCIIDITHTLLQYVMILSIVLSNSIWTRIEKTPLSQDRITIVFGLSCFLLCGMNIIQYKMDRISKKQLVTFLVTFFVTFASIMVLDDLRATYAAFFVLPLLFCLFYFISEREPLNFWKRFVNVVTVLSLISLFFYLFGSILKIIPPTGTTLYRWTWDIRCSNWYNLYYESYFGRISSLPFFSRKNTGLYPESPMFMIMVCTAIAAELAFAEKPRKKMLLILLATLCSIMSTTGYVFVILLVGVKYLISAKDQFGVFLRAVFLPMVGVVLLVVVLRIYNEKIRTSFGTESASIRINHLFTGLQLWIKNPIFGIGYGRTDILMQATDNAYGDSVGLPLFLAYSGIWLGSLYFIPLVVSSVKSLIKDGRYLFFLIGTFFVLFLTAVNYLPIMICIMAYMLSDTFFQSRSRQKANYLPVTI